MRGFFYNNPHTTQRRRQLRRNQTDAERILWHYLRGRRLLGHKFYRQYGVGYYIVDFYCSKRRLVIELDGGQHNLKHVKSYDQERTAFIEGLNITVIRFWNNEVFDNIEGVIERIRQYLEPPPFPL